MPTYECPDYTRPDALSGKYEELVGCGHVFEADPDFEGFIDCPNCGMFWDPAREPSPTELLAAVGKDEG